jgi:hypothetical protein
VVALVTALTAFARPSASSAQLESVDPAAIRQAEATPKGTLGPGLVGARLGAIAPSFSELDEVWALAVFPVVGAAVDTLTRYFVLDGPGRGNGSVAWVRKERRRLESQVDTLSDRDRRALELAEAGTGLFRWTRAGMRVAQPKVSVLFRPKDTPETLRLGGLKPRREIRITLFSGVF